MADWPRVEAIPGAAEALEALSEIGIQCVATNATESDGAAVARALARVGLDKHLGHFFTSREMGVEKPDPEFFAEVARRLDLAPDRLMVIGNDYLKDIRPAEALGMATVWIGTENAAHPESLEVDGGGVCELPVHVAPDPRHLVVADLHELARIARGWRSPR
jgi:putative hydrolase of the HAD superfamily